MKKTIWKFPLQITDVQKVLMPLNAEILTAQVQDEQVYLWAMVNPDAELKVPRFIEVLGTGTPILDGIGSERRYISTVQTHGGRGVWHIFEAVGV